MLTFLTVTFVVWLIGVVVITGWYNHRLRRYGYSDPLALELLCSLPFWFPTAFALLWRYLSQRTLR